MQGKTCVAYCRVSTAQDEQIHSLANQKAHYLEKFARDGFKPSKTGMLYRRNGSNEPLKGIFADEGISGTSLKNRRAFEAMLQAARKGVFSVIYVKNVSRFARSVEDFSKTLKDLAGWGVEVIFEDGNLSSLNGAHEITLNLLAAVAQEESRNKSVAIKFGIRRAQLAGKFTSQSVYGYDIVEGYLQINEKEAATVRQIFDLYIKEDFGVAKVCRELNKQGIPTKKGFQWSQNQVVTILDNPLYIGRQTCHKVESFDVNRHTRVDVDPEDWIIRDMPHLRIIDDIVFSTAQSEREKRRSRLAEGYRQSTGHLLSNLIYCGNCGGNLKRKKRHTLPGRDIGYEFTCQINDMYGKSKCNQRNAVSEKTLIALIKDKIKLLQNYNMDDLFAIYSHLEFTFDASAEKVAGLQSQAAKLNHKIDTNFDLYDEGEIPHDEYKRRNSALRGEVITIQADLDKISNLEAAKVQAKVQFDKFRAELKTIDLDNLTNQVLRRIIKRVTISTLKPAKSNKTFKTVQYDYQFLNKSIDDMIKAMDEKAGAWAAVGKRNIELFSDIIGVDQYDNSADAV